MKLSNLRPWEEAALILKRHWIVYFYIWFYFCVAIFISVWIYMAIWSWFLWSIINIVFWMLAAQFIYIQWLNFELDIFIVTNNRVIWVEQVSFLNRTVSEANLWQVQEVNSKTVWIFANLLDYWTITIQTAWNATNFEMTYAPNAIQNSRKILNIVDSYRDAHSAWWQEEKTP